jgi:hypothetical protein
MSLSGRVSETKDLNMGKGPGVGRGSAANPAFLPCGTCVRLDSPRCGPSPPRLDSLTVSRILAVTFHLLLLVEPERNTCKDGGEGSASQHE